MPKSERFHVDGLLSNLSQGFAQKQETFIANKVLPPVKVAKESDKYATYQLKDVLTAPINAYRADGAQSEKMDWDLSNTTYQCLAYSLKGLVTQRSIDNADKPLRPREDTMRIVTQKLLVAKEVRAAAAVFNTTTFTSYTSALGANDKWDAYTSTDSDPLADSVTAKNSILKNSLHDANTLIIGPEVLHALKRHPQMLDIIKYTGSSSSPAVVTANTLAQAFEVDQVLIGKGIYNANNIGQTASPAYIWGKFAMFAYIDPNPTTMTSTMGATFEKYPFKVFRYKDDSRKGEWIEPEEMVVEKVITAGAGYLFSTVVS